MYLQCDLESTRVVCAKFKCCHLFLVFSRSIHNPVQSWRWSWRSLHPILRFGVHWALRWGGSFQGPRYLQASQGAGGNRPNGRVAKRKNPVKIFCEDIRLTLKKNVSKNHHVSLLFFFEFGYIHLRYHLVTWVIVCTILSNKRGTEFIPIHLFPWGEVSLYRFHWWDRCHWTTARCWHGWWKWWTWTDAESEPRLGSSCWIGQFFLTFRILLEFKGVVKIVKGVEIEKTCMLFIHFIYLFI